MTTLKLFFNIIVIIIVMGGNSSSDCKISGNAMVQKEEVQQMIKSDRVVIFSKSYCPYCHKAKAVFKNLKQPVTVIELDERDDGHAIQEILGQITGAKTVPRVFINGNFVGGGTDVENMSKNGTLQPLLAG